MSITLQFDEAENVELTADVVERPSADRIEFTVTGTLTVTGNRLEEFAGAALDPVEVSVSTDAGSVDIDLTEPASLRLESVDVGVATPDEDLVADGIDTLRSSGNGAPETGTAPTDALSFTVDGEIRNVPPETLESITGESLALESLTFALDETRSDGGSEPDVLLELALFGYGIAIRRDGVIVVGRQ